MYVDHAIQHPVLFDPMGYHDLEATAIVAQHIMQKSIL